MVGMNSSQLVRRVTQMIWHLKMDYLEKIMVSEFYEEMAVLENHENIFDIFDT